MQPVFHSRLKIQIGLIFFLFCLIVRRRSFILLLRKI